jgi:putative methionine-R-sulfoxide reductase with GAF domain
MNFHASDISTHLDALNYENVETSITELMEKTCQTMKNTWANKQNGKGKGQWTWSVFSVRNQTIEQKAAGGSFASSRRTVPKREAKDGMIARVIKQEESHILYEPETAKLSKEQFLRILDNTQSAIVARIERSNDDVVGVINIESNRKDDFEIESMAIVLLYIGKIISQALSNDGYRTFSNKYNLMFSGALSLIEGHASRSPEVFYRDIVELFCLEFRLEAVALFINISESNFFTAAHSHIESSPFKFPEIGKRFQCNSDTLLERAHRTANTCISLANISLSDLIGQENTVDHAKHNNFARLYSFDIPTSRRCVLVAVSPNKSIPPDQVMAMRYIKIIEAFTKTFSQLEQERDEKLTSPQRCQPQVLMHHNGSSDDNPASETPRVFLSYSHDSDAHKAWVRQLAERLREGGVEVTLDQWDLPLGADVVRFMELGIRDADRVLMVCTANYVAKAEERKGGAGNEAMIVTGHVARATDTIKFVPIVRDHAGEPLVPAFLGQRLWLDFRDDGLFEQRLEELLRELHGAPRYPKPPLGRNPFAGPELEAGTKGQESPSPTPGPSRGSRETAGERQGAGAHQEAKGPSASAAEGNPSPVSAPPAAPAPPITSASGVQPV